jgi:ferritin-like metal-binding protein YciE
MAVKNPKEMFVKLLSDVRRGTEQSTKIYQEISEAADSREVKEALQARVFISDKILTTLDQCFNLIGEKPVKVTGRLEEVLLEDFRRELAEIDNPVARHLFILAKANHLLHFRIAEYNILVAAADMTGNYAIGVLLESCLADKLALAERTRHVVRNIIETKRSERIAA